MAGRKTQGESSSRIGSPVGLARDSDSPADVVGSIEDVPPVEPIGPISLNATVETDRVFASPPPPLKSQPTDVTCWAAAMASFLQAIRPGKTVTAEELIAYCKSRGYTYPDDSLNDRYFRQAAEEAAGNVQLGCETSSGQSISGAMEHRYQWLRRIIAAHDYILTGEIRSGTTWHHCYVIWGVSRENNQIYWWAMDSGYRKEKGKWIPDYRKFIQPPSNGEFGFYWLP